MAIVPPSYANGLQSNSSPYAPVVWEEVSRTNNSTIDMANMPYTSTVEYVGYYKALSTGYHTFACNGSAGVTSYAWVSGAPRSSDRIKKGQAPVQLSNQKCYAIIIPPKPVGSSYWVFADPAVVGTFPGYGYWPKTGYGDGTGNKFNAYYAGTKSPSTACGYTQVSHKWWMPGDIRTYAQNFPRFVGQNGGPSWQGPEDPNFTNPCYDNGTTTQPLVRLENNDFPSDKEDPTATARTMGKTSQVYLDTSFKAEGSGDNEYSTFEQVASDGSHSYVWPQRVNVFGTGKKAPERVQIRLNLRFYLDEQEYTFEWKSRDGLKIWYKVNQNDARYLVKFPDTEAGANPCNKNSSNTASTGWEPNGGQDGFTGKVTLPKNAWVTLHGYATGVPSSNTHGFSLVIKNAAGDIVWTTAQLLDADQEIIGIDECGYNALLTQEERIEANRDSESYTLNGWRGYVNDQESEFFNADKDFNDDTDRGIYDTRQYLWQNSLAKCRGGESINGRIYLRQNDYYFIRCIVSNHLNESASFNFRVTTPGGTTQSVQFSGNGNPGSDAVVGGSAGGNGIPINTDILCASSLYTLGKDTNDLNFAFVPRFNAVLSLTKLGIANWQVGLEGQKEVVDGQEGPAGVSVTLAAGTDEEASVTLSKLLRGGTDGITEMSSAQIAGLRREFTLQKDAGDVLPFELFRSAITSQAVVQWGKSGNYTYIYHSVAEVITSICDGTTISPFNAQGAGALTRQASANSAPDCFDMDLTILSNASAGITTKCFDECPPDPTQYPNLTSFPVKQSDYDSLGFVAGWKDRIDPKPGFHPTGTGVIVTREPGDTLKIPGYKGYQPVWYNRMSSENQSKESVLCGPGRILSIPWTVSDIYYPDDWTFDKDDPNNEVMVSGPRIEWSSNTYTYDPNNAGPTADHDYTDTFQKGVIIFWISAIAGGPRSGNYSGMGTPAWATTPKIWATYNYDLYRATASNPELFRNQWVCYAGNTAGPRWMNFVVLNQAKIKARPQTNPNYYKWNLPEPGTQEFVDMFEVYGYKTNEFRMYDYRPIPKCNTSGSNPNLSGVDPSFRSAPDMIPFI